MDLFVFQVKSESPYPIKSTFFFSDRRSGRGVFRSEPLQGRKYTILKGDRGVKPPGRIFFLMWVNGEVSAPRPLRKKRLQSYYPSRWDGMTVSPTAQNSKIMAHKSFFRNNISFSKKMLRFFLIKKTTLKFEGR